MNKKFNDFITEFIDDVTQEYRRLARGTPKNDRNTLGLIQRKAMEAVAKQYNPRDHRKATV